MIRRFAKKSFGERQSPRYTSRSMKRKINCELQPGSLHELLLFSSIQTLFRSDERLLHFMFHHQNRQLRREPNVLLQEARALNPADRILIRVALDLWSESGNTRLADVIETLDYDNFIAFIRALLRFREIDDDSFHVSEWPCCD